MASEKIGDTQKWRRLRHRMVFAIFLGRWNSAAALLVGVSLPLCSVHIRSGQSLFSNGDKMAYTNYVLFVLRVGDIDSRVGRHVVTEIYGRKQDACRKGAEESANTKGGFMEI